MTVPLETGLDFPGILSDNELLDDINSMTTLTDTLVVLTMLPGTYMRLDFRKLGNKIR